MPAAPRLESARRLRGARVPVRAPRARGARVRPWWCKGVVVQRCVVCALASVVDLRASTARDEEGGDALD
eukprot:CAMPEP_0185478638 /NCGR_PEP_ID=MMETSP1366-20130426/4922_1 /TAXON_ID=38817 /ORGANISM="Gephyrocapsa oceanica, Strain RCC1303" /LENGTH=69 /DNA_ID=CAMNT_0028085933 /DNA_START=226 /DNA_END=432 /DNA_ORIENTATION=+